MAPIVIINNLSLWTDFTIAFFIGIGFGFFLESGGFGNARKLALQFYFRDLTVFKVMFTAIITAMTGLIILVSLGYYDFSLLYINPTYLWPGIIGGIIMGFGFAIGGYCPGTGLVGVATLKLDAIFNLSGAMFGMAVFSEIYPYVENFMFSGFLGDRLTLPILLDVRPGVVGFAVIAIALAGFYGAEWAEKKYGE